MKKKCMSFALFMIRISRRFCLRAWCLYFGWNNVVNIFLKFIWLKHRFDKGVIPHLSNFFPCLSLSLASSIFARIVILALLFVFLFLLLSEFLFSFFFWKIHQFVELFLHFPCHKHWCGFINYTCSRILYHLVKSVDGNSRNFFSHSFSRANLKL